jgi:hypothetical protein
MENNTAYLGVWMKRTSAYLGVRWKGTSTYQGEWVGKKEHLPTWDYRQKRTSTYLGVRMEENIYLNGSMDRREYPPTGKNGWKRISAPLPYLGVWIEKNI